MASSSDTTTLVCLFHHQDHAEAAINDLRKLGIPESSIRILGDETSSASTLEELGVPARDRKHLAEGLRDGGTIVAVSALERHVSEVEKIFGSHRAEKIDEADVEPAYVEPLAAEPVAAEPKVAVATGEAAIPIVAEDLVVGKRTVDQGGVRVFRRVVEIPVEEAIDLREEHVKIDRRVVDRPATDADLAFQDRSVELTETAEEVVVVKQARVVEEILVGKDVSSHTEHIQDSVRHTEVEVEEIAAGRVPVSARE